MGIDDEVVNETCNGEDVNGYDVSMDSIQLFPGKRMQRECIGAPSSS